MMGIDLELLAWFAIYDGRVRRRLSAMPCEGAISGTWRASAGWFESPWES